VTKLTVGVINYGIGNHASVRHALHAIGFRCRVTDDRNVLDTCDVALLPGVGAFRPAIDALRATGLDEYLLERAAKRAPILGICLGMQLLTEASDEDGTTAGLGLIPGNIVPLREPRWHIGWNTIELVRGDPLFAPSDHQPFYFNHSYAYQGPVDHQVAVTRSGDTFAAAIRRGAIAGVQFHPEKSQLAGHALLKHLVTGLRDAD
jgi:glutamine amidotransferase